MEIHNNKWKQNKPTFVIQVLKVLQSLGEELQNRKQ